jgi:geranylgeranyl diphosphate synthase type I
VFYVSESWNEEALLEDLGDNLEKVLDAVYDLLDPDNLAIYDASTHLINAGGKLLRPLLVLLGCKAVGGEIEKALPLAAGVELAHVASLIHDDIIDQGVSRRNVQAVHMMYGLPTAIITGDLLIIKNFCAIAKNAHVNGISPEQMMRVLEVSSQAGVTLCEGECMDLEFMKRYDVTEEECINMYKKKTAIGFSAPFIMGAILGGGTDREIEALGEFGILMGVAFQIQDDYLGLFGEEKRLGKPLISDIAEGKRTFLVVHALQTLQGDERHALISVLGNRNCTQGELERAVEILRSSGSAEYVRNKAAELVEEAKSKLTPIPDSPTKEILLNIADFVRYRSR